MPNFNQKGPMGQGPMTGRRMGKCTNFGAALTNKTPETSEPAAETAVENVQGRGFGFGRRQAARGMGCGCRNRFRGGF